MLTWVVYEQPHVRPKKAERGAPTQQRHQRLFDTQGGYRIDGCGAACRDDAGYQSAESERQYRATEYQRVPAFDVVELCGDQARAADGDWNADEQPDQHLNEGSAQHHADDLATVGA